MEHLFVDKLARSHYALNALVSYVINVNASVSYVRLTFISCVQFLVNYSISGYIADICRKGTGPIAIHAPG